MFSISISKATICLLFSMQPKIQKMIHIDRVNEVKLHYEINKQEYCLIKTFKKCYFN